jgi:hypothetical protein
MCGFFKRQKKMGATVVYVVLDTESSICRASRHRRLVSLAYEVILVTDDPVGYQIVCSGYEIVVPDTYMDPDPASINVHQIQKGFALKWGRPLNDVIQQLGQVMRQYQPRAIVGHDICNDIALLISEAVRCGIQPEDWFGQGVQLICTKLLSLGPCAIPLPMHLRYRYPCDAQLNTKALDLDDLKYGLLKWPNLEESYRILVHTTEEMPQEHDARGDVARCRAIFSQLVLRPSV